MIFANLQVSAVKARLHLKQRVEKIEYHLADDFDPDEVYEVEEREALESELNDDFN